MLKTSAEELVQIIGMQTVEIGQLKARVAELERMVAAMQPQPPAEPVTPQGAVQVNGQKQGAE